MTALRKPTEMTAMEFQSWEPPVNPELRWQLVEGEPVCMAPPSPDHGRIQAELAYLLTGHLREHRPGCEVLVTPGVVPGNRPDMNHRIPDLGVTCSPPSDAPTIDNPVLLIEILSPSNTLLTRANAWAYLGIQSVEEILLLHSTRIEAELLRREPGGGWPGKAIILKDGDHLELTSIGFNAPLRACYRATSLLSQ